MRTPGEREKERERGREREREGERESPYSIRLYEMTMEDILLTTRPYEGERGEGGE